MTDDDEDDLAEIEEAYLDANHTHFLLVDDGSQHVFGIEKKLKARLEKFLGDRSKLFESYCILPVGKGWSVMTFFQIHFHHFFNVIYKSMKQLSFMQ